MHDLTPSIDSIDEIPDDQLLRIGDAAELVGLSLRTVRYWEEIGLVEPSARSKGGFRLYSATDLRRLLIIRAMKPLGLTLEQMRQLLSTMDAVRRPQADVEAHAALVVHRTDLENRIAQMEQDLVDARRLLAALEEAASAPRP